MKKHMTILAMLFILIANGQSWNSRVTENNPTNIATMERKYLAVSVGADVQNAIWGGKKLDNGSRRNEQALDLIIRAMLGFETEWTGAVEAGVFFETFHQINFFAIGGDINKVLPITRTIIGSVGGELSIVWRKGVKDAPDRVNVSLPHYNPAVNLRARAEAVFGTTLFFEAQLKWTYRSEIEQIWGSKALPDFKDALNGYISIGSKF